MLESALQILRTLLEENFWALEVFLVLLLVLLANFFLKRFLNRLRIEFTKTSNIWDDAVLAAAHRPVTLVVWVIGLTFAAQIVVSRIGVELFQLGMPIRSVGIIIAIGWFFIRLIRNLERRYVTRSQRAQSDEVLDRSTIEAMAKLLCLAIIIIAAIVVLQTLGFSISGVLAFSGIGGIAVGFAAKDMLSNFFGSLTIYLDRPFGIGDWICSPDRDIEGTVEYIGWRLTRVRTFDLQPMYIPNSIFTNIVVKNPSRMQHRRLYETIGIRYSDITQMDAIVAEVQTMLTQHSRIDEKQTLMVNFNTFSPSSVDFFVYAFTHTTDWCEFHSIKTGNFA